MSAVNATPSATSNATPKVNAPKRCSRKRPRKNPVGSRRSKRIRREDQTQEDQTYVPGSWVLEQVSTGGTDGFGNDIQVELIRLFVVDRSGYVESPIPSVSFKTILAQCPLPNQFVNIRNSNTRFIRDLQNRADKADTTTSEDEVDAIVTERDSVSSESTAIDSPGMKRSKDEVNAIVPERDSSASKYAAIDSPGTRMQVKRPIQPRQEWSFAALRGATGTSEFASPFLSITSIHPYCALPEEEKFDVIKKLDLEEADGNQEDSDLDWMDMELVYPGEDVTESAKSNSRLTRASSL